MKHLEIIEVCLLRKQKEHKIYPRKISTEYRCTVLIHELFIPYEPENVVNERKHINWKHICYHHS